MKESLWSAGAAAFAMHSLMIATLALGINYPQGSSLQDFQVEVMFASTTEKGTSALFASPLEGEVDSEHSEEAGEGHVSTEAKYQGENPSIKTYPAPATPLCMCVSSPRREIREQPLSQSKASQSVQKSVENKKRASPIPNVGEHPSGGSDAFPIHNPPPVYPREARRKKIQGIVMVRASLREDGAVAGAITLPPRIDPLLETAALRAIHQWRFKPGIREVEVPIEFKLVA